MAIAQFLTYRTDGMLVGRRWTAADLCRLAIWNTVSFALPLCATAIGIDALVHKHLYGVALIFCAGVTAFIGTVKLRTAEGINPRQVKSGELYKRAMTLSKQVGVRLDRVSVVPFGRGRITNAFGGWRGIAVTDDYGHWLRGSQLDFVIGHELSHLSNKHGLKKLAVVVVSVGLLIPAAWVSNSDSPVTRMCLLWLAVLLPLLTFYFVSRRFEYGADREGVEAVGQAEVAIDALLSLYRHTGAPTSSGLLEEFFSTHPSLDRRLRSIASASKLPDERLRRAEQELQAIVHELS